MNGLEASSSSVWRHMSYSLVKNKRQMLQHMMMCTAINLNRKEKPPSNSVNTTRGMVQHTRKKLATQSPTMHKSVTDGKRLVVGRWCGAPLGLLQVFYCEGEQWSCASTSHAHANNNILLAAVNVKILEYQWIKSAYSFVYLVFGGFTRKHIERGWKWCKSYATAFTISTSHLPEGIFSWRAVFIAAVQSQTLVKYVPRWTEAVLVVCGGLKTLLSHFILDFLLI